MGEVLKVMRRRVFCFCLPVLSFFLWPGGASAQSAENVTIAGGSVTGIYYQAAMALCDLMNGDVNAGYQCAARTSSGSVFNINALAGGFITFGLVQSDRNGQAWNGTGEWQDEPVSSIRSIFALHDELVHLVVRGDAGISFIGDLKGKKVNLGNVMSGQRGHALKVMELSGLDYREDVDGFSYQQGNALSEYAKGVLDAFFYTVGVPSIPIAKVMSETPSELISLDPRVVEDFVRTKPYYVAAEIPADTYPGQTKAVRTFGVRATLMTDASVPDDTVYHLVRMVFENFEAFREANPAFRHMVRENALKNLTAPLHPGAIRYYREQGWID